MKIKASMARGDRAISEDKKAKGSCRLTRILSALLLCRLFVGSGQPLTNIPRVGALHLGTLKAASVPIEAFQRGLRELGYVEGKNIVVEYRYADGKDEKYGLLAAELVALKPAVIVAWGTDVTAAVKKTTTTIPVVFALADRPDVLGLSAVSPGPAPTSGRPTNFELSTKRLELLKETIPDLSRVTVLGLHHPSCPHHGKGTEAAARSLGIQLQAIELKESRDLDAAYSSASARTRPARYCSCRAVKLFMDRGQFPLRSIIV